MPEKTEPALADKEIIMAALNIKSMNFGTNFLTVGGEDDQVIVTDEEVVEGFQSTVNSVKTPVKLTLKVYFLDK